MSTRACKMALTYSARICVFSKLSIDESAFSADNIIYKKHGFQAGLYDRKRAASEKEIIMNTVITISRQYGSGGRFVGRLLADSLGIPFYDKEIIAMASENSGFAQDFIKENEQKMKGLSSVSFTPSVWGGSLINSFENFESRIYASETEAIEEIAKKGACVIVGRCADYVLKDKVRCMNVFIYADMPSRVDRVINVFRRTDDQKKAERLIKENDRMRARHYRYYTDSEWGASENYHISLNTSAFGVEKCAEILKEAYLKFDSLDEKGEKKD